MHTLNKHQLEHKSTLILLVVIDQISKNLVLLYKASLPYVLVNTQALKASITLAFNKGVSFSWLEGSPKLALVSCICLLLLLIYIKFKVNSKLDNIAKQLLLAGGLSNLLDRLYLGHVVDYMNIVIFDWPFYTFNLADVFISISAGCILFKMLRNEV